MLQIIFECYIVFSQPVGVLVGMRHKVARFGKIRSGGNVMRAFAKIGSVVFALAAAMATPRWPRSGRWIGPASSSAPVADMPLAARISIRRGRRRRPGQWAPDATGGSFFSSGNGVVSCTAAIPDDGIAWSRASSCRSTCPISGRGRATPFPACCRTPASTRRSNGSRP